MKVSVGCCGFPVAQERYYRTFPLIELQSTFYKLPRESTLQRWREAAPSGFEFVVKAWQVITHPSSSPTWKRAGITVGKTKAARYGYLKPTAENFEAFNRTLDACSVLQARICLIQCPPSFHASPENVRNLKRFLTEVDRRGLVIAWEPRGNWVEKPQLVRRLCKQLGIVHVVDLLRRDPSCSLSLVYSRLHGLGNREVNYTYRYTNEDLKQLARKLSSLEKIGCQEAYILFNNVNMFEDAKRFSKLISRN
jgi:uncharacterized protein YecE (DUF72 family)